MYAYVGSKDLAVDCVGKTARQDVDTPADALSLLRASGLTGEGETVVTFIVDLGGRLWIADRHSEHVACADGQSVLSAGEMTFEVENGRLSVVAVSNQSLGYCPEPKSWPMVETALDRAGIPHPGRFTSPYLILRCPNCDMRNIVKDDVFECAVCGTALA